jgi:hypothetical protein
MMVMIQQIIQGEPSERREIPKKMKRYAMPNGEN